MIRAIVFTGLFIISTVGFGQSSFAVIDDKSKTTPDSLTNFKEIAYFLTDDLKTDTEKARALYIWIAHNITYDLSQMNSNQRYNSSQEIIDEVLTNRQGICQHYSELYLAMSKSVGLKSYLISGYTRDVFGNIADVSHAWNGVRIDSNFFLIDVTWAAGYELGSRLRT